MVDKFIEKLGKETFKNILYMAFVACFWVVTFRMFKPSLLKESFIFLGSLLFCLSLMWSILSFFLLLSLEYLLLKSRFGNLLLLVRVEIYLIISLIIKSTFLCIGYYYTTSFTTYLQMVFISVGAVVTLSCILAVRQYTRKKEDRV